MDTTTLLAFPAGGTNSADNTAVQTELKTRKFYGDALDGDFGKNSNIALAGQKAAVNGDPVDVALSQVGVKETPMGSNSGPTVNLYLASCGLGGSGLAWCAAFLTWLLHRWADWTPNAPRFTLPITAGAFAWENLSEQIPGVQIFHPGDDFTLRRGDIIIYTFSHIGIFLMMGGDGLMRVVEGNTDYAGSRTGGCVLIHPRSRSLIRAVVRLPIKFNA